MEGKRMKVFGVVMALLLVFSFAATFSVSNTVSAGTQKWSKISIPGTDDMQLAPMTEVGTIAVSPDGDTLFAAVYDENSGTWNVTKSVDDGYTWRMTGLTAAYLATVGPSPKVADPTRIIAIKVSPAWEDDDIVVVATLRDSYISEDRGKTFKSMGAFAAAVGTISSFDVGLDSDGDATYLLSTNNGGPTSDVWVLSGFSGWTNQFIGSDYVGTGGMLYGVLAAAFSPNYGEDGTVLAVVNGTPSLTYADTFGNPLIGAHLRAESDITVNNWGSYIQDAHFFDEADNTPIQAKSACMAFALDYNSVPAVFVGLNTEATAYALQRGDAFRVDLAKAALTTSSVTDLNIRGSETRTDVFSIAVSGPAQSAFIYVGLQQASFNGQMNSWISPMHYSDNGGEDWMPCLKPASCLTLSVPPTPPFCSATVIMSPDFATTGIAYAGTGFLKSMPGASAFSGFYATTKDLNESVCWNGRGLLDCKIDSISDIVPSPAYDDDSTLFMVTRDNALNMFTGPFGFLWETKDGGLTWELIVGMILAEPLPGLSIDKVEIPALFPDRPNMFVTGPFSALGGPTALISTSSDAGNLWASSLNAPFDSAHNPLPAQTWAVIDGNTLIVSNANKIWKTTDFGGHWYGTDDTEISTTETITDMKLFDDKTVLVGTNQGNVYMCTDWDNDFTFTEVGLTGPAAAGDTVYVAFDSNYAENGFVYAGVNGSFAGNGGIYRIDATSGDTWDQIYQTYNSTTATTYITDIKDIDCDGNGIVWAIVGNNSNPFPSNNNPNIVRSVNPSEALADDVVFERVDGNDGLVGSTILTDMETAPTQTYVFAIGRNNLTSAPEIWAYIDTLIKPTLISPADGTTAAGVIIGGQESSNLAHVTLMWEDMPKAQWYDYQVAYDSDFGSLVFPRSVTTTEGTQASVELFLGEKYYWHVRVNGSPVFSQWSETWSFTTPLGPASAKPICMSPTDGEQDVSLQPTLQWTSAVQASGFELVVAKNCDWASPVINLTGSSALGEVTAYQITQSLQQSTNYCWKVRATNSDTATNSPWSDFGTFTTLTIPPVVSEGTPTWVWVVIALSAVLLVGVVVLIIRTRRPV